MFTIGSNVYLCLWLPPCTYLWMPVCCTVANHALAMLGRHTVQEAGSSGTISMSSDHCHDREATMMRNFSIVVTVTRVDHKQRPSVSIPPYPTLLFVFPIMCSLSHLIYFPSSASLVFWCRLPKKPPLRPMRPRVVWTLSSEAMWGWEERWALHQTTMTRLSVGAWLHNNGFIQVSAVTLRLQSKWL